MAKHSHSRHRAAAPTLDSLKRTAVPAGFLDAWNRLVAKLSGAGTLGEHFSQLFNEPLADSSWADRRARLPWEIFADLMRRVLRPHIGNTVNRGQGNTSSSSRAGSQRPVVAVENWSRPEVGGVRAMQDMNLLLVRFMVAALLTFLAFNDFFATVLTIAYRMGALGAAEPLGRLTPGDDFRRLVPLMEAVPAWLHGLWVLAGGLYLAAIACLVRRVGSAHLLVLAAVCIEVIAKVVGRPIITATGVVVNPDPSVIATVIIPFVLPLSLALVLWQTGRRTSASMTASG